MASHCPDYSEETVTDSDACSRRISSLVQHLYQCSHQLLYIVVLSPPVVQEPFKEEDRRFPNKARAAPAYSWLCSRKHPNFLANQ